MSVSPCRISLLYDNPHSVSCNCRVVNASRQGLADIARHVIGCHLTQETRVQNALDNGAGNIRQAIPPAASEVRRPARSADWLPQRR